ncbi:MAG: DUF1538 family protein, partial [Bacillota bacterium]|nr:DUF1538 family protein [Bacillota bacterium]
MNIFYRKLREVFSSVAPVVLIVVLLRLFLVRFDWNVFGQFLFGAGLIVIGLTFFLIGVDLSVTPLGGILGKKIIRRNRISIVVASGLILGFIISIAEPGLMI